MVERINKLGESIKLTNIREFLRIIRFLICSRISLFSRGLFLIIALFLLNGCASNVGSNWDCPVEDGYRCILIRKADSMAIGSLIMKENQGVAQSKAKLIIEKCNECK
jgi:hypothetical protein